MKTPTAAHALSLCLAAVVTLAMLGGIDRLSQPETSQAQWAQPAHTSTPQG